MRRLAHALSALLLILTAFAAAGQLPTRYRVTVALKAGDELETISRQLAATYGGRLEPYAEAGFEGFAVAMSQARARLLSSDPRVALVEEMPPAPAKMKIATEAIAGFGTYTYDGSGNITSIGDTAAAHDSFVYDRLGRLASATLRGGAGQAYTYDRYGNILTIVTVGDTVTKKLGVDKTTNQIDLTNDENGQPNNVVGSYDDRGNLTSDTSGQSFVYDGLDMMKEATVGGVRRFHIYSASDERVVTIKAVGSARTGEWTIRDPAGRTLRRFTDTNGTLAWAEDYIYAGAQLLAAEVTGPERTRHFHLDHLGTPRLITGNGGAQIAQHHYQAFGTELPTSTNDAERAKFTGHERDETTLDYMHARYYDPSMGRFLSVDPVIGKGALRNPQMWNRYSYAVNNPIRYTDPDGKLVRTPEDVREEIKRRELQTQQAALVQYTKFLASQVNAGKLTSKQAIDLYYGRAKNLTKATSNPIGNALLVATGAALDRSVRGATSSAITRESLGQDTLHHFFINASNTYEGIVARSNGRGIGMPVWLERFGANTGRGEDDVNDINANNLGARYGDMLENGANVPPSAIIKPPPPQP